MYRAKKQCGTSVAGSPDLLSGSHSCTLYLCGTSAFWLLLLLNKVITFD